MRALPMRRFRVVHRQNFLPPHAFYNVDLQRRETREVFMTMTEQQSPSIAPLGDERDIAVLRNFPSDATGDELR